MKRCSKCKKIKAISSFNKNGKYIRNQCRECHNAVVRNWYYANRVQRLKQCKRYYGSLSGYLRTVFNHAKYRCDNPKATGYEHWGGRGIKCLFTSFEQFFKYVTLTLGFDSMKKLANLDLDRINNNGHYAPNNIQFVSRSKNLKNRRKFDNKCLGNI